jgi:hypothetical protein
MTNPLTLTLTLTPRQADAVDWALDPMSEFWDDDNIDEVDPKGEIPRPVVLPELQGRALDITGVHGGVLHDLRYRIGEQLDDIEDDNGNQNRAGWNAWEKIRGEMSGEQIQELNQAIIDGQASHPTAGRE